MTKTKTFFLFPILSISYFLFSLSCGPPVEETNIYRKEKYFPDGLNVPVAPIVSEWAGKVRSMGSTWLIDGGNGQLFSAKHVTDVRMDDALELGGQECKIFLNGRVYDCLVDKVPPLRDAVVLKLSSPFDPAKLPRPYKIAKTKVRVGDEVFIQGFHPHPREITEENEREGFKDKIVPIFRTFYGRRFGNKCIDREIVFDSLEATVVELDARVPIQGQEEDPLGDLRYETNTYFNVITSRNHKFSFAGLSGGVVVRLNQAGEPEAVGIMTLEKPFEFSYDEKGNMTSPCGTPYMIANSISVTPIESVKELYEYTRQK